MNHAVAAPTRALVAGLLAAAALTVAGCTNGGSQESADLVAGKQLFTEKCGSCHTLNRAGTKGLSGPNLDDAFAVARKEGWGTDSVRGVVLSQILYPGRGLGMPADIVTGEDAQDVAAYVASAAAVPGKEGGLLASAVKGASGPLAATAAGKLFAENCGSCHVFEPVGTTGKQGPALDGSALSADAAAKQIAAGGGGMPAFGGQLSQADIESLAELITAKSGS
jgi:mono/diheme cytochrome c family protein